MLLVARELLGLCRRARGASERTRRTSALRVAGSTATTQCRRIPRTDASAVGLALWVAPLLLVGATLGLDSLWAAVYLFFTKAALVTFGGAYAVLGYVTTHLVAATWAG